MVSSMALVAHNLLKQKTCTKTCTWEDTGLLPAVETQCSLPLRKEKRNWHCVC